MLKVSELFMMIPRMTRLPQLNWKITAECGGNEESENGEVWIGCSDCFRWYHKYCIEGGYESNNETMSLEESKEAEFSCNTCLKKKRNRK